MDFRGLSVFRQLRRQALRTVGTTGIAAAALLIVASGALIASTSASRQDKQAKRLIGLQLYSVRDECAKDLPGVVKAVAKMGYTGVEFAGYHGRTAEELRKLLDENGLKCYGTHVGLDTLLGDNLENSIKFNKVLGNKFLVVPWIPEERRNSRAKIIETAHLFNEIAKKLEPHGMILGYHNHTEEFKPVEGEIPFDTLFSNTDKRVAVQFDIGNALVGGAQAAPYIAKYPGKVLSVHVKDHSTTNPTALLGEGEVNWKELLPLIKGKAGTRWFIIEQESYKHPPMECVEKCLRNFEKMMAAK
jgi:sugar phosphate isomerase/epimerase